ncbi:MAG: PrsW family glutamic-type intramembrane protease, partial [Nocardioidaceae bacterium]
LSAVTHLFLWRGVAAPFVHPMFTMMTGLGVGLAVRYRHVGVRILAPVAGYCSAVLLHMGYNAIASFTAGRSLTAAYIAVLLPTLVTLAVTVLLVRRYERRVLRARLRDYTAYGWLRADHLDFIATTRGRRVARRHARRFGKSQRDLVRQFQCGGLDLAVLRDRIVRGVAGAGELHRESQLLARLRLLSRKVMLPDSARPARRELTRENSSW